MNENKIKNTKVGDDIHFFVNGSEDRGIVVKMNNEYVTVFKESTQNYDDIHINDTFFIKDILINKEWDKMEDVERFELLKSIHAPTPRFLSKSWDQLPKEIKTLLVKNNGIETTHNKDKDPMDTTVRTFDNKGFGGVERGQGKGKVGEKIGEQTKDGEEVIGAGNHDNPPKFHSGGEKQEGLTHNVANFDQFKTIEETENEQKGDKNVTGIDYKVEGGDGIGVGASLSGEERAQRQSDLHQGKRLANEEQKKIQERKERKENTNTEVPEKVTEGVSALKAWQLWLAEREQQVLKDGKTLPKEEKEDNIHEIPDSDFKQEQEDTKNYDRSGGESVHPLAWQNTKRTPHSKSWEERLLELKSSVETSIHGNAARNPNSGVNTNTSFDAPKDYEGFSHDGIRLEQFKHEKKKPNVGKEKVNINIDGKEKPADSTNGGSKNNEYGTPTENPTDKKGRIISEKDKK